MSSKLKQKSWGVEHQPDMRKVGNYTHCPYTCHHNAGRNGVLGWVVGYDKDLDLLIVKCPVCLHYSTVHGLEPTFKLLEGIAKKGPILKEAALLFLEYPETYDAMRQCIEKILSEYENVLRPHLEWLKSKLGHVPLMDHNSSWNLGEEDDFNCQNTTSNLEIFREILGITEQDAQDIKRKIKKSLEKKGNNYNDHNE